MTTQQELSVLDFPSLVSLANGLNIKTAFVKRTVIEAQILELAAIKAKPTTAAPKAEKQPKMKVPKVYEVTKVIDGTEVIVLKYRKPTVPSKPITNPVTLMSAELGDKVTYAAGEWIYTVKDIKYTDGVRTQVEVRDEVSGRGFIFKSARELNRVIQLVSAANSNTEAA